MTQPAYVPEEWEKIEPVFCRPCYGKGQCPLCHGSGKQPHPETYTPPASDICGNCEGSGVCITCRGAGKWRPQRRIKQPLLVASPGFEICWGCDGRRHCNACHGGGFLEDGGPCDSCELHAGICDICDGAGEVKPVDE